MVANFQDENLLWPKIREFRDLNIKKHTNSCFVLVSDDVISEHFRNLSKILNIDFDAIDEKVQNLSEKTIRKGIEMFLYLNSCENKEEQSFWINFYGSMLLKPCCAGFSHEYRPIKEILLSTLKAMQFSKSKDGRNIASKIVKRLSSDVKFQYLQPNNDESNIIWTRNVQNMIGKLCRIYTQTLYF